MAQTVWGNVWPHSSFRTSTLLRKVPPMAPQKEAPKKLFCENR